MHICVNVLLDMSRHLISLVTVGSVTVLIHHFGVELFVLARDFSKGGGSAIKAHVLW